MSVPAPLLDRPVSAFISPDAITLRADLSIDAALAQLRARPAPSSTRIIYFYVVDAEDHLLGVLSTRRLILAPASATVRDLMTPNPITLRRTDTLFDALELFAMHRLLAIPVVDASSKMLGILDVSLYTDEVFDLAETRQLNEVFQLIGVHLEQTRHGSPWKGLRIRFPWLLANVAGGLACAALASCFEQVVKEFVVLALFIPLILTLAESVAVQSMTLAIESAGAKRAYGRALLIETLTALLLGLSCGGLVALVSAAWKPGWAVVLVIGGSICVSMFLASLLGRVVPKLIYQLKLNPRIASGPVTLAVVDVLAVTTYLCSATMILLR
jgi:magnesium transporter